MPQGTVLGPVLFLIYINDLPDYIHPHNTILFADDTTLLASGSNLDRLNGNLGLVERKAQVWFGANKLVTNPNKTQRIVFSANRQNELNSVKLLGIYLDSRLCWSTHVSQLIPKLSSIVYLLRKLREFLPENVVLPAYHSLFGGVLSYGLVLWGDSAHADEIFKVQKRALRAICRLSPRTSCRPHFRRLGVMPLSNLFIYQSLLEIYRRQSSLPKNSSVHSYNTRHAEDLTIPYSRLHTSRSNKLNLHLFNHLPLSVRGYPFASFKSTIRDYLKKNTFYTVNEFLSRPWSES